MEDDPPIHASAFRFHSMGCMLLGASGTGKSRLLAEAMLHGAHLIADDRVQLSVVAGNLIAAPVPTLAGVMELRGFGLITCPDAVQSYPIHLVVELTPDAKTRLPEQQTRDFLGISVPYLHVLPVPTTSIAGLLLTLKAMQEGRRLPTDWRPGV